MQHQLSPKQQAVVAVAAFSASGDIPKLNTALTEALNASMTVNEVKEILIQLYAYAGFPRSLNALGALMTVLTQRQSQSIKDAHGPDATPAPAHENRFETGTRNQTQLVGHPVSGPLFDFAPPLTSS